MSKEVSVSIDLTVLRDTNDLEALVDSIEELIISLGKDLADLGILTFYNIDYHID